MVEKINSTNLYDLLLCSTTDKEIIEIILMLQKYTKSLEDIVFPPPKDPLVRQWIKEGLINKDKQHQ